MNLPIAIFFLPYALFLIIYFFFLFFNCYHLHHFGIRSFASHALVTIFLLGTVVILGGTAMLLAHYDWTATIDLHELTSAFNKKDFLKPL